MTASYRLRHFVTLLALGTLPLSALCGLPVLPALVLPPAMPQQEGVATPKPAAGPAAGATSVSRALFTPNASTGLKNSACSVRLSAAQAQAVLTEGHEGRIAFTVVRGTRCLTAASSEDAWLEARVRLDENEVELVAEPNPSANPRGTWVGVVAGAQSFRIKVMQDGVPAR